MTLDFEVPQWPTEVHPNKVEWSSSLGSHSLEVYSCEKFRRMFYFGGWCRTVISIGNGPEQSVPREDSFSPGCTVVNFGGMAQLGECSRFNNQGQTFPRVDSFSLRLHYD
jgi:hypothetical protein